MNYETATTNTGGMTLRPRPANLKTPSAIGVDFGSRRTTSERRMVEALVRSRDMGSLRCKRARYRSTSRLRRHPAATPRPRRCSWPQRTASRYTSRRDGEVTRPRWLGWGAKPDVQSARRFRGERRKGRSSENRVGLPTASDSISRAGPRTRSILCTAPHAADIIAPREDQEPPRTCPATARVS